MKKKKQHLFKVCPKLLIIFLNTFLENFVIWHDLDHEINILLQLQVTVPLVMWTPYTVGYTDKTASIRMQANTAHVINELLQPFHRKLMDNPHYHLGCWSNNDEMEMTVYECNSLSSTVIELLNVCHNQTNAPMVKNDTSVTYMRNISLYNDLSFNFYDLWNLIYRMSLYTAILSSFVYISMEIYWHFTQHKWKVLWFECTALRRVIS